MNVNGRLSIDSPQAAYKARSSALTTNALRHHHDGAVTVQRNIVMHP